MEQGHLGTGETPYANGAGAQHGPPDPAEGDEGIDDHALLPLEGDAPREKPPREIKFIQVMRFDSGTEKIQFVYSDIPAGELTSWGRVFELWGGGLYRVRAKCAKKRSIRDFPHGDWVELPGDPKPLLPYDMAIKGPQKAKALPVEPVLAASPAPPPPAAPVVPALPSESMQIAQMFTASLDKLGERFGKLEEKLEHSGKKEPSELALMLQMQSAAADRQSAQAIAAAERQTAQAIAANAENNKVLLGVLTALKPAPALPPPPPDNSLAVSLLALVQKFIAPDKQNTGMTDSIALIKGVKEVFAPAEGEGNPFKEITGLVGQLIAADATKQAAKETGAAGAQPPEPKGQLYRVPGHGLMRMVAPEPEVAALAPVLGPASLPAPPPQAAPLVITHAPPPPPIVARHVEAEPPVAVAPIPEAPVAAAEPPPAAPAAPPPAARVAAPALVAPPQPAPEPAVLARVVEIVPCGSPEPVREPVPEPPVVVIDRAEAGRKIQALQRLPLKDREQIITRIPGLGGEMGSQLAFILDKMPAAALRDFIGSLSDDHIGLLQYATIPGA